MLRSQAILNALIDVRSRFDDVETTDVHGAVLTLTRTSAQAITTAGSFITWQSEVRGYQITWSGTDITIPATGWYLIQASFAFSVNLNNCLVGISRNGTAITSYNLFGDVDRNVNSVTMTQYFSSSDTLQIRLFPSANCNVNVVAEGSAGESPILHIVQLSGGVDV